MFRILLIGSVVIAILGGLFYWRFIYSTKIVAPSIKTDDSDSVSTGPKEVPKTPDLTSEDNTSTDLQSQIDSLKKQIETLKKVENYETRIKTLETSIEDLRAQIVNLSAKSSSTTQASTVSSKSPLYIPLGSSGGPWATSDWYTTPEYQVVINPGDYSGYTSMQLEVILRVIDPTGTAKVRLYNVTDSSVVSSEISTASSSFTLQSSSGFQLPSGAKTYQLQVKNSAGKDVLIQNAKIKVNF